MYNRYSDFEELRPTGETTHIPDDKLNGCGDWEARRQRVASTSTGYPDQQTESENECRSCGASIPTSQTKCRFCLTNHLDGTSDESPTPDTEWILHHIVHLLVEASTFYTAVAKGAAAATLLTKADRDPAVDNCQLIYDLDVEPAAQLADKWPSIPEAVRATSESGEQLLTVVREWTGQTESTQSRREGAHTTFLYNEGGHDICVEGWLTALLESAENDVWLVPAIALQRSVDDDHSENRQPSAPSKMRLECRKCDRNTVHQFQEFESIPDEEWSGQPMWYCQVCETPRYGPNLK
ncbi:hypothetical protein [Natronorubrum sp. FCH18a]|uniref:biosurfactant protein 1 n=1 Tax=Natronorubrum sp. FCH18a TaxID=3447018 RepID=UPI003F517AA1